MLVLTRTAGQSIRIGDDCSLRFRGHAGLDDRTIHLVAIFRGIAENFELSLGEWHEITPEICVCNAPGRHNHGPKTMIGIEAPPGLAIVRAEACAKGVSARHPV